MNKRDRRRHTACERLWNFQLYLPFEFPTVTPRRVRISMAFHEAAHVAASLLLGAHWVEARLIKTKREWDGEINMGHSTTYGPHDHPLVGAAGEIGEQIWRVRRGADSLFVPFSGASDNDMMLMNDAEEPFEQGRRAKELLCQHQDLVAWLARQLIRKGKIDADYVRRRLPRKLYTDAVRRALAHGNGPEE